MNQQQISNQELHKLDASVDDPALAHRQYDLVVIGAGIVGLATAREFLIRFPDLKTLVIDKENAAGSHQTGHNSGVIHTGIYYAPGSLKARACAAGHKAMVEFCTEREIPFRLCGKVIVALDVSELPRLEELFRRGTANGVAGLEIIDRSRLSEIEPHVEGVKAIYSPTTGVVDYSQVAHEYVNDIREHGGELLTNSRVDLIKPGQPAIIQVNHTVTGAEMEIEAQYVITCAGLYSDKIAGKDDNGQQVQIIPFRGSYYKIRPEKAALVRALIYPVPNPDFPFLGVHFTRLINDEVLAGPNAVLAFAREGYRRGDINLGELTEALGYSGFHKLARKYWRVGLLEMYREYFKGAYTKELQRYVPAITADDLEPGPSGVRAQALAADGKLVDDFLIYHRENVAHVRNAPSPAATSSLVIARTIVDETASSFELHQ